MKKYDVFISSKSEDYKLAEQVYDFLVENGLSVFLASRELDRLGVARGDDAIDEAIDSTTHMIVVASSAANVNSKWVRHEWGTFSHDLRSGYRSGNLITVLTESVRLKDLPSGLRHNQSFNFKNYKKSILSYVKLNEESQNDSPPPDTSTGSSKKRGLVAAAALALMLLLGVAGYYMFFHDNSRSSEMVSKNDSVADKQAQEKDYSPTENVQNASRHVASIPRPNSSQKKTDYSVNDTLFDWLGQRKATMEDLEKCKMENGEYDRGHIRVLKNSIYARHGLIFKDSRLTDYFSSECPWYKGTKEVIPTSEFNEYERANIKFLGEYDH